MRLEGTLKSWNGDRGFGFIAPTHGGQDIFAHISAFPSDGLRPRLGERLFFEVERNHEGKQRAINIRRSSAAARLPPNRSNTRPNQRRPNVLGRAVTLAVLIGLGVYGYSEYSRRTAIMSHDQSSESSTDSGDLAALHHELNARCDGRTHCSQMTSCAEAKFFLKHCPDVQMDGNNDGVPCEKQWCTSPFAK
jgi:cold shock CspA family protein